MKGLCNCNMLLRHGNGSSAAASQFYVKRCSLPDIRRDPLDAAGMPQPTIMHHWNWWACGAYTLVWAALVFYFYVRIR